MDSTKFIGNDVALEFVRFNPDFPPLLFRITKTSFIDNDTDVKNSGGRKFYLPGNYFEHSATGLFGDEWTFNYPVTDTCGRPYTNEVSAFPMTNKDFTGLIYLGIDVSVANSRAAEYAVPADELAGKTITSMTTTTDPS